MPILYVVFTVVIEVVKAVLTGFGFALGAIGAVGLVNRFTK